MYIVTAFALNYSTQNMGLPRELFLNIGLLVGGLSCLTIPCFAWLADRFGRRRVYITGTLIGTLSAFPFFMALEAQSIFWIVFFSIMLANIAHDMVVCVCNNRCLPKCLVPVIAIVALESVIRLPVWLAVDLHLLLPLHSSLTLPGTGIASPFICWLDA